MWAFYGVWLATLAHAGLRGRCAWRGQAVAIGFLAVLAVLLNWLTTRHHLAASLQQGMWAVAGMDLALLTAASLAWVAVRRLRANGAMAQPKAPQAVAKPLQRDTSHA